MEAILIAIHHGNTHLGYKNPQRRGFLLLFNFTNTYFITHPRDGLRSWARHGEDFVTQSNLHVL